MCGRFTFNSKPEDIKRIFAVTDIACEPSPSWNIAPTHEVPVIIRHDNRNRLGKLHWGLVPSWARDLSGAGKLINARIETVIEKPSFKNAFKKRRCLILANGFYEWRKTENKKQPWYFKLPNGGPFAFAGLWETWKGSNGQKHHSCTILTTVASESIKPVHDRMPVILRPEAVKDWLNPDIRDPDRLKELLHSGKVDSLKGYPVSNRVNALSFNDPACIEPFDSHSPEN